MRGLTEGSFLRATTTECFFTEKRASREREAEDTGEMIADGIGLQGDQMEWVPKHRRKVVDEGRAGEGGSRRKEEAPEKQCTEDRS